MDKIDNDEIRKKLWLGKIPVRFNLDQTDNANFTIPIPLYVDILNHSN